MNSAAVNVTRRERRLHPSRSTRAHRLGAIAVPDGVEFTVWAPSRSRVDVQVGDGPPRRLTPHQAGYFAATFEDVRDGDRYWYLLDGTLRRPDPASRFQPDGPHGPSQVVDPQRFRWTDGSWRGIAPLHRQVIYEMHVGTFSNEGTWAGAIPLLPALVELGVTTIEVMPISEFDGTFGWGYDGVDWYAPTRLYGTPDDVRRFVDAAHGLGLGVVLDVVYNHLGPSGNYLRDFSEFYLVQKATEWGDAVNFDAEHSQHVRRFVLENVAMWIEEYHFDGLRLDATHALFDDSPEHIVSAIGRVARGAARQRAVLLVAENEPQHADLLRDRVAGRDGVDAIWNEDWHHSLFVALTGRQEAYYTDYTGTAREMVALLRHGVLFQGQHYTWQNQARGQDARGLRPTAFVQFLENHDQVANSGPGLRLHQIADRATWRAAVGFLLLSPSMPMLFQGQEFASSRPFHYFAQHDEPLAAAVSKGRAEFMTQFPPLAAADGQRRVPSPGSDETFVACKLDDRERRANRWAWRLHRDLIALRAADAVLSRLGTPDAAIDAAVLGERAFLARYGAGREERLLLVNFGHTTTLRPMSEPLLAPPTGGKWVVLWSSDRVDYDGPGEHFAPEVFPWVLPARSTVLLHASPASIRA